MKMYFKIGAAMAVLAVAAAGNLQWAIDFYGMSSITLSPKVEAMTESDSDSDDNKGDSDGDTSDGKDDPSQKGWYRYDSKEACTIAIVRYKDGRETTMKFDGDSGTLDVGEPADITYIRTTYTDSKRGGSEEFYLRECGGSSSPRH